MEEVSERERRSGTKETTDEEKGKEISSVKLKKKKLIQTEGEKKIERKSGKYRKKEMWREMEDVKEINNRRLVREVEIESVDKERSRIERGKKGGERDL